MRADTMVARALQDVPKAVAAGITDMGTGMLLEGDLAMNVEKTFKKFRGNATQEHDFQEVIVNSKDLIHVFTRLKSNKPLALTAVSRMDANTGLVVAKSREIVTSAVI